MQEKKVLSSAATALQTAIAPVDQPQSPTAKQSQLTPKEPQQPTTETRPSTPSGQPGAALGGPAGRAPKRTSPKSTTLPSAPVQKARSDRPPRYSPDLLGSSPSPPSTPASPAGSGLDESVTRQSHQRRKSPDLPVLAPAPSPTSGFGKYSVPDLFQDEDPSFDLPASGTSSPASSSFPPSSGSVETPTRKPAGDQTGKPPPSKMPKLTLKGPKSKDKTEHPSLPLPATFDSPLRDFYSRLVTMKVILE